VEEWLELVAEPELEPEGASELLRVLALGAQLVRVGAREELALEPGFSAGLLREGAAEPVWVSLWLRSERAAGRSGC